MSYTYDDLGRIATITESVAGDTAVTRTYHYDGYGQLKSVDEDGVEARSYGYDLNGNRTHEDGLQVAVFDTQDRLTTYNGTTYTYTDSGSLTSKSDGVDTTTYQYDLLGNLRDVTLADGTAIHYEVDGRNRRIGKTVDGVQEYRFVYRDQLNPIAMFDGDGDLQARFVYGTKGHVPDYMVKDGDTYRFITDHLGSVRLLVNANDGTIAQKISYDEWGNVTDDTNPGFQPFGFAGGLYDPDTGLVRFGARDYDPSIGRWTAKDPILFEGGQVNLYVYVGNDPVNRIDPSGMVDWEAALRAAAGMIGNALGVASGIAVAGVSGGLATVVGGAIVLKSSYGFSASAQNMIKAIQDEPSVSNGTMLNDVAELAYPGNETAQGLATAADLAVDLMCIRGVANIKTRNVEKMGSVLLEGGSKLGPTFYGNADAMIQVKGGVNAMDSLWQTYQNVNANQ